MAGLGGEEKTRNMVTSSGYCFSGVSSGNPNVHQESHLVNQLQSFESNPEIYSLTTGMEMIGFPPKNLHQQQHGDNNNNNSAMWKAFLAKSSSTGVGGASSSKTITGGHDFYGQDHQNLMVAPDHHQDSTVAAAWHDDDDDDQSRLMVDDSSLRCVFPCQGNERPSQGLSLSLNSTNPSTIGLQSFELRSSQQQDHDDLRFVSPSSSSRSYGFFGKPMNMNMNMNIHQQQQMIQDGFLGKAANHHQQLHHDHHHHHHPHGQFQIRNSKYLGPAQELLNEFCDLGTKQTERETKTKTRPHNKASQWQDENASSSSSSKRQPNLHTLELLDLQKRKAKLLSMLEEVDRRYRNYCEQMKAVVSSFEAVAGNGAATVYSALASKAMSRHFRCLRDGIVGQIKATKKAMGDKDTAAPGTTRGETPRLRLLDQTLRQQRAFQQMTMMETHPWRPQRGLPERSVSILRAWLFEHFLHPYPSDVDKHILARQTGLSRSQVSNWFINARVRLWKPMVEDMYLEETKEQEDNMGSPNDNGGGVSNHQPPNPQTRPEDQKPTADQLVRIDSECLSSIINNNNPHEKNEGNKNHTQHLHSFGRVPEAFGAEELDFSSYNHQTAGHVSYANHENAHHNFVGGGGGVSLTLGLQQHGGGGGVSLAFSSGSHQNSLFYGRDQIEDCPPVQYSLLDGEGQTLPYRNLMGAQLLHDLAG